MWLMCATMAWLVLVAHVSPTRSSIVVYVYSAPLVDKVPRRKLNELTGLEEAQCLGKPQA